MNRYLLILLIPLVACTPHDECDRELEQSRDAERCMNLHGGTPLEIFLKIRPIVLGYNNTDTDFSELEDFLNKNCPKILLSIQCLLPLMENKSECPDANPLKHVVGKIQLTKMEKVSNYVCANNGEVLKNLVPDDGIKFFFLNEKFNECFFGMFDFSDISFLCPSIDSFRSCVRNLIGDHTNKFVSVVVRDLIDEWKTELEC